MIDFKDLSHERLCERLKEMDALVASLRHQEVDAIIGEQKVILLNAAHKLEEALKESREKFRMLYDASPMAIVLYDPEGNMLQVNNSCLSLFGVEDIRDILTFDLLSQKRIAKDIFDDIRAGNTVNYQSRLDFAEAAALGLVNSRKTGVMYMDVFISPMLRPGEKAISGYLVKIHDITAQRLAEEEKQKLKEQLVQAQKMEAVGAVAGGMAHDFNNMLAVIMGNAEMAIRKIEKDSPVSRELNVILQAAIRSKDLTMKILTFARQEKLEAKPTDINSLINDLVAIISKGYQKNITIKAVLDREIHPVMADGNHIHQVLLNICNNARDAMPDGGVLTLSTEMRPLTEESCEINPGLKPGRYCVVKINDTGIGMTDEVLSHVFEPFFTTKSADSGTGFGLYISYGIVQSHGGHIQVSSRVGEGTDMLIYLPAVSETDIAKIVEADAPVSTEKRTGTETILVVDDEEMLRELATLLLQEAGYKTLIARSGKEAISIYAERGKEIDMVILDMIMPEMDGREVFCALKEINPNVKVVVSSGFSNERISRDLLKQGVIGFMQKPFRIDDFCAAVGKALEA